MDGMVAERHLIVFSRLSDVVMSGCACRIWNNNSDLPGSVQFLPTQMPRAYILNIDKVIYFTTYQNKKKEMGWRSCIFSCD